jgi:N-acetyl-anhydromuramyl-L-alanine amidase AmpD
MQTKRRTKIYPPLSEEEPEMPFQLTWLPTVLKNAGLKVAEQPGWPNHGTREMRTIKGVMCHHTVGPKTGNMPSLKVLTNGRPGLAGPLAQLGLGRDGTFYVIAAGRSNHAGNGEWRSVTNGNDHFIGIEAENTGIGKPGDPMHDPWPAVQLDAYRRGIAAILKHIGQKAEMCCAHKEYCRPEGRKIDPHSIDMDEFRKEIAAIMDGTTPVPAPIPNKDPAGRPTLRRSAAANPIFLVQELQKKLGFVGLQVDGDFGPLTEAAVRRFQRQHELVPDGIVGPKTWEVLSRA